MDHKRPVRRSLLPRHSSGFLVSHHGDLRDLCCGCTYCTHVHTLPSRRCAGWMLTGPATPVTARSRGQGGSAEDVPSVCPVSAGSWQGALPRSSQLPSLHPCAASVPELTAGSDQDHSCWNPIQGKRGLCLLSSYSLASMCSATKALGGLQGPRPHGAAESRNQAKPHRAMLGSGSGRVCSGPPAYTEPS